MKKKLILYPDRPVIQQSFVGIKSVTVPDQSLSLMTIIKRFTRGESLPIEKAGIYETRFGDLEKLQHADLTEKFEKVNEIKEAVKAHNKRQQAKHKEPDKPAPDPIEDPTK